MRCDRAFSADVDAGSAKKMRQDKNRAPPQASLGVRPAPDRVFMNES
jgi:hypothetical protein